MSLSLCDCNQFIDSRATEYALFTFRVHVNVVETRAPSLATGICFSMSLVCTSDALIQVSDYVLAQLSDLEKLEYNKKGRKYRFVNNNFQRIREEDKHLIVSPDNLDVKTSIVLAYYILRTLGNGSGEILELFPDFCLSVLGVARQLEVNHWYEEGSSVTTASSAKYDPSEFESEAIDYAANVTDTHISQGLNLMVISKLNFLHTDHHIGTKLEGYYMSKFISDYYGEELLQCQDILIALKSFVHWGNIKGILYKLEVPNVNTDDELIANFAKFPDPLEEFKVHVYNRYPLGTLKYSLLRKCVDVLADSAFAKLVPYPPLPADSPQAMLYDLKWLYQLCHDIEKNPIVYHLRSAVKGLSSQPPVNLSEISNAHAASTNAVLAFVSIYMNSFENTGGNFLLLHSKIPKFNNELIAKHHDVYDEVSRVSDKVRAYKDKDWSDDDIVLRLQHESQKPSLYVAVMQMREQFADDYE